MDRQRQAEKLLIESLGSIRDHHWKEKVMARAFMDYRAMDEEAMKKPTAKPAKWLRDYLAGLVELLFPNNVDYLHFTSYAVQGGRVLQTRDVSGVDDYLERVAKIIQSELYHNGFQKSAFYQKLDSEIMGIGYIYFNDTNDEISYEVLNPEEVKVKRDNRGRVRIYSRSFQLSAYDIWEKFENVPDKVMEDLEAKRYDKKYDLVECIYPTKVLKDREGRIKAETEWGKYTHSIYIEGVNKYLLNVQIPRMPIVTDVYEENPLDSYGLGKMVLIMPDIISLFDMTKNRMKLDQRNADPPSIYPSSMDGDFSTRPGSRNEVYSMAEAPQFMNVGTDASLMLTSLQDLEMAVMTLIGTDLIRKQLDDDRDRKTATEVQAQQNQSLVILGLGLDQYQYSDFDPLVKLTYESLKERGKLPTPPKGFEMFEENLKVELNGTFVQRARTWMNGDAVWQGLTQIANLAQVFPTATIVADIEESIATGLSAIGFPQNLLKEKSEILQKKQQMEAQQQAMADAEMAKTQSEANLNNRRDMVANQ